MRYHRTVITLLLLVPIASQGHAQDVAPPERETIQQLVQQVKELQNKVAVLESQQRSSANPGPPEPTSAPPPSASEEASTTPPESLLRELHELHGIQWRGFGELDYKVLNQRKPDLGTFGFDPGSHGSFYTGDFDLFLTSNDTVQQNWNRWRGARK